MSKEPGAVQSLSPDVAAGDYDWVVEFDIRGLFDNLDHDLLMTALRKHCQEPWICSTVERWVESADDKKKNDRRAEFGTGKGTPQGAVS